MDVSTFLDAAWNDHARHAQDQRGAALDAAGKAERAVATMDAGQWPAARGDFDALRSTLGQSGDAVQ